MRSVPCARDTDSCGEAGAVCAWESGRGGVERSRTMAGGGGAAACKTLSGEHGLCTTVTSLPCRHRHGSCVAVWRMCINVRKCHVPSASCLPYIPRPPYIPTSTRPGQEQDESCASCRMGTPVVMSHVQLQRRYPTPAHRRRHAAHYGLLHMGCTPLACPSHCLVGTKNACVWPQHDYACSTSATSQMAAGRSPPAPRGPLGT